MKKKFFIFLILILTVSFICGIESISIIYLNLNVDNKNKKETFNILLSYEPDIIFLLELTENNFDKNKILSLGYEEKLYHITKKGRANGIGIFSKIKGDCIKIPYYRLDSKPENPKEMFPMSSFYIEYNNTNIGFLFVHIPPPFFFSHKERINYLNVFINDIDNGLFINDIGSIKTGSKAVILGDFNTLPYSLIYNNIKKKGLNEIFAESKIYKKNTWKLKGLPVAVIDHVFTGKDLKCLESKIIDIPGSDHRAIYTKIYFK